VRDGNGYHYALTRSGLRRAAPRILSGSADVAQALAAASRGELQAAQTAARSRWPGRVLKGARIGGRVFIAIGVAADIYEFATAENKARTITTIVGGWAGAAGGAWAGAKLGGLGGAGVGSCFAGVGAGPGAAIGGIGGSIIGGIGGYFGGRAITRTVYDWIFEPGIAVPVSDTRQTSRGSDTSLTTWGSDTSLTTW